MMITFKDDNTKVEDALNLGIHHYLIKPFNVQTFDDKIMKNFLTIHIRNHQRLISEYSPPCS
jgi:response regulator of citrate/malate metabolism